MNFLLKASKRPISTEEKNRSGSSRPQFRRRLSVELFKNDKFNRKKKQQQFPEVRYTE
jgi:hypothetical protein